MHRLIEKGKTYRIPHRGSATLLQITSIGDDQLTVKDIKTGKTRKMSKRSFSHGLDEGIIYVSAESGGAYEVRSFSGTLYHGSPKKVAKFDGVSEGRYGRGLYLTPDLSTAEFYASGGRQGKAGQKLSSGGHVYEFKISGKVLFVYDEEATMGDMQSDVEEAEQAFSDGGDLTSRRVTKFLGQWAEDYHSCDMVWIDIKNAGVLSPLNQVLVLNRASIKSLKET